MVMILIILIVGGEGLLAENKLLACQEVFDILSILNDSLLM
jgi:hypothetical protein